ncbi:REP element-mobilizing transposase RayT [Cyclobacterium lianum]|uniref:REP element-mobilizing transposase RayT n=1 Tax=Cyclobacterium lianum TaxID=388280 RepID=A0A1M7IXX0_9BACT|nr:transposase [Cyclobacterium lianum]SHM45493.1 REP element-mobilizing transposase RayT [Cyclobacterium lianum]
MAKFKNKYRIASARAQWWDYGWNAVYFITICTRNREHFFGEINDGKMILSSVGVIADILWYEIPNHSKFVELGDFVVMPNHIHGILILDKPDGKNDIDDTVGIDTVVVETGHALSLQPQPQPPFIGQNRFQNIGKNTVSSIIGSYKSAVTKHANRMGFKNGWQPRFHDHIIRDDAEYQRISDYIINNPANWKDDKFYAS